MENGAVILLTGHGPFKEIEPKGRDYGKRDDVKAHAF